MQLVDHLMILILFVVQPVYSLVETRRHVARVEAGEPANRVRLYRQTALLEWAFLAALIAAWWALGRPFVDLGMTLPDGTGFWIGCLLLVLLTGYLLYAWREAKQTSAADKAKALEPVGTTIHFLPYTNRELHNFFGLSVTAGIVEEIVYRGFVLWYLAHVMPLWAAVAVSSVGFGIAHAYQGVQGAFRCGLVGLALCILYVVTGSIWLPIVAHVLVDVLQGATVHELLQNDDDKLEPQVA